MQQTLKEEIRIRNIELSYNENVCSLFGIQSVIKTKGTNSLITKGTRSVVNFNISVNSMII